MIDTLQDWWHFISNNPTILWALGAFSVLTFLASLLLVPFLIVNIPEDYFIRKPAIRSNKGLWLLGKVFTNLVGWILILLGLAMLVLPGQGILTIAVGVLFIDFPRKAEFERWMFQLSAVRKSIDWIRQKAGKPTLKF